MDLSRTIIIGNSGSGKSWLASRIAFRLRTQYINLDLIHWLHGGYSVVRERDEAIRLVKKAAESNRWVIEGIYGFLIDEIKSDATALVWLCLDDAACVMHIRQRGIQGNGTVEAFSALQNWAASYRSREGSRSYSGHAVVFKKYMGEKIVLRSRNCVTKFAKHFA